MSALIASGCSGAAKKPTDGASKPKVYMYKEISSENLLKIYDMLGRKAEGRVAVKLSTGEPGNDNYLNPDLIKDLVHKVNGTIIECNTAYGGGRADTESHLKAAADHGFTAVATVDIMDADGEVPLPVAGGKHLKEDFVGKNYPDYDFTVVLSHFKGHPMGGFGGAIKNISIGIASSAGKAWIHSAGKTKSQTEVWKNLPPHDDFLESMAEAAKAIIDHCGDKILYISVAPTTSPSIATAWRRPKSLKWATSASSHRSTPWLSTRRASIWCVRRKTTARFTLSSASIRATECTLSTMPNNWAWEAGITNLWYWIKNYKLCKLHQ